MKFLLGIFVCLILIPTRWTFHVDIQALGSSYLVDEPGADLDEMHWNLAIYRQESFDTNAPRLGRLFFAFRSASMLLVLEVVAWLIDFAVR